VAAFNGPVNLNWMMTGPQADFWPSRVYTGQFYSENTPMRILAWRGQVVEGFGARSKRLIGTIGDRQELGTLVKQNDWNQYVVIARGGTFLHIVNGRLMAVMIDDDPASSNNWSGQFGIEIEATTKVSVRHLGEEAELALFQRGHDRFRTRFCDLTMVSRYSWIGGTMDRFARDIKHSLRLLAGNRGFAAAVLLTIALGVGGTAAVFSVVYAVLLQPLPYPEPDRLVRLWEVHPGGRAPIPGPVLSIPTYRAWAQSSTSFQDVAAFRGSDYTVTSAAAAQRLRGTLRRRSSVRFASRRSSAASSARWTRVRARRRSLSWVTVSGAMASVAIRPSSASRSRSTA
jgi:hypothetical protein